VPTPNVLCAECKCCYYLPVAVQNRLFGQIFQCFRAQSITINFQINTAHSLPFKQYCYDYIVCIQSTCTQSVICHVVCYAQPQKATISCSFYLPPCFLILPAPTAAFVWLPSNCILIVSFLCYFCVFLAAESLKKTKTLQNLCPCIVFSLLPPTPTGPCYPTHIYLYLHVKGSNHYLCYFLALSGCQNTLKKSEKCNLLLCGNGLISYHFTYLKIS